jgi:hypothetical protein
MERNDNLPSDALATVIITSKLFGVFSELTIDVNDIGSVIIDSRRDSYSSGHSSDAIPRKNASRTMCNSSRDEHFAKMASVGRFELNALVKCISSGDIVVLELLSRGVCEDDNRSTSFNQVIQP